MLAMFFQAIGFCFCMFFLVSTSCELGRRAGEAQALLEQTHSTLNDLVEVFTEEILLKRLPPTEAEKLRERMEAEVAYSAFLAHQGKENPKTIRDCFPADCERCHPEW